MRNNPRVFDSRLIQGLISHGLQVGIRVSEDDQQGTLHATLVISRPSGEVASIPLSSRWQEDFKILRSVLDQAEEVLRKEKLE